jgi:hypothetical protein
LHHHSILALRNIDAVAVVVKPTFRCVKVVKKSREKNLFQTGTHIIAAIYLLGAAGFLFKLLRDAQIYLDYVIYAMLCLLIGVLLILGQKRRSPLILRFSIGVMVGTFIVLFF